LNTIDITQRLESFKQILQRRDAMIALSANQDTNEEEYRQKLITPLLTQVLGYEIEALRPEQSLKDFGRIDDLYSRDDRLLPIESKKYGRMQ
jgi:predicted type IV restriction endonuclease